MLPFWSEPTQITVICQMLSAHQHSADIYQGIKQSTPRLSRNSFWELTKDSAVAVPWIYWGLFQKKNGGLCEHALSTHTEYLIGLPFVISPPSSFLVLSCSSRLLNTSHRWYILWIDFCLSWDILKSDYIKSWITCQWLWVYVQIVLPVKLGYILHVPFPSSLRHILLALRCERRTVNGPGEQHNGLCHFKREKKRRNNSIPWPWILCYGMGDFA